MYNKKFIILILFSLLMLIITGFEGCERFENEDKVATSKGNIFMQYLLDNDSESMKSMFCERTLLLEKFDEQLQSALEFIDGNITSYGKVGSGGTGKYISNGKITIMNVTPYIEDIITDKGKTYRIIFYMFTHYDGHDDVIGISELAISLIENNEEKDFIEVGKIITRSDA